MSLCPLVKTMTLQLPFECSRDEGGEGNPALDGLVPGVLDERFSESQGHIHSLTVSQEHGRASDRIPNPCGREAWYQRNSEKVDCAFSTNFGSKSPW